MSNIKITKLNPLRRTDNLKEMQKLWDQLRKALDEVEKYLRQLDDNKQDKT